MLNQFTTSLLGDLRLPARFWAKVLIADNGCWEWIGDRDRDGYGRFWRDGQYHRAHRVAHETLIQPFSEGLVSDHLCRWRACVNPFHIEPVTCRENVLRGNTIIARAVAKTQCPQGHPYDETNTYTYPSGARACRTCRTEAMRRHRRRLL